MQTPPQTPPSWAPVAGLRAERTQRGANVSTPDPSTCGPLDAGDRLLRISTEKIPDKDRLRALTAAAASPAFDGTRPGPAQYPGLAAGILLGPRTVAKAQHRQHEQQATATWFEHLRAQHTVPAPRLLDVGAAPGADDEEVWWVVLARCHGEEGGAPTPGRQRALGKALRAWHEEAAPAGLRLDAPGGVGVLLGTPRAFSEQVASELAARMDEQLRGQPVRAVHGDAGASHNTLFQEETLTAVLDPGAVHVAPTLLDLAWALALDLPRGGSERDLVSGYGEDAVDTDALEALLPLLLLRRWFDVAPSAERSGEAAWLRTVLQSREPDLLQAADAAVTQRRRRAREH